MRIVKLSADEFPDLEDVDWFFEEELAAREPRGKFRIPRGWIAADGLQPGEPILFSYRSIVRYSALAGSGRQRNNDDQRERYPYYFVVDPETLQPATISLVDVERRLRAVGVEKVIVKVQGGPIVTSSPGVNELWAHWRDWD